MKVGDHVWIFDINRRVYPPPPPSRVYSGAPIYREHWCKVEIVGETKRSWIVGPYRRKVPKNGPPPRGVAFDEREVDDDVMLHEHRYCIAERVRDCWDADALRRVAEILGYDFTKKP